ncbi:uncharacterized protein LOC129566679 [Sitodiplosis mosellana]|uniref:uncharacterized protein LOC129566679 n=1 Tax=Sitodiplosis mosellana TaxID=263140 RepID=UPI002444A0C9|nr:uncharacterized protein LOC129566679 [Sitodiplosis mosellana]
MAFNIKNFLFLLVIFNVHLIQLNLADDDYTILYDRVELFNGTGEHFEYKIHNVKKDDAKNIFTVDAMLGIKQDISNDWKVSIEIFKLDESTNEYQSLFALPKFGTCAFMKTIYKKYFYDEISKYSNLPSYDVCPVPQGKYEIKGYPIDMNKFEHLKSFAQPGSYRLDWFMIKDDVAVYGVSIYGQIAEKE